MQQSTFEQYYCGNGQISLRICPQPIEENPYLARHCGTCNRACNVPFNRDYDDHKALTPYNPGLCSLLAEVGGLAFSTPGNPTDVDGLPSRIALIRDWKKTVPDGDPIYAVSPELLFDPYRGRGGLIVHPRDNLRAYLHLPAGTRLFLTGNAQDDLLLWMWDNRSLALSIIENNLFDYVATPNYSAYGNKCPVEWTLHQKRSFLYLNLVRNATPNPIVTLTLQNDAIFKNVVEWLHCNPQVNCVAVNLQMMKDEAEMRLAINNLQTLVSLSQRNLHVVVAGPSTDNRMLFVGNALDHATIVSSFHLNRNRVSRSNCRKEVRSWQRIRQRETATVTVQ